LLAWLGIALMIAFTPKVDTQEILLHLQLDSALCVGMATVVLMYGGHFKNLWFLRMKEISHSPLPCLWFLLGLQRSK